MKTVPIGVGATSEFIREVAALAGIDPDARCSTSRARAPPGMRARSIPPTSPASASSSSATPPTRSPRRAWCSQEFGFTVVGIGTYSREFAREVRDAAKLYGVEALITDDYLDVEARVAELQPELVLGTQMERHIAKRLGIPCAVISAPVHVQDFPARYSPQMGFEGANVLFDTWVHPLMMGLEEHLLTMFRGDFEFHDGAAASHLGRSGGPDAARTAAAAELPADTAPSAEAAIADLAAVELPAADLATPELATAASAEAASAIAAASSSSAIAVADWAPEAQKELQKIPFFVRGKARRNTERFAAERGVALITVETLYDAKAHFAR